MKNCPLFMLLFITCALGILSMGNAQCSFGQYFIGENDCRECSLGTFMNRRNHNKKTCIPCTSIEDHKQEILHPCNSTHDTVYQCMNGYFNTNGHPVVCQQCDGCNNTYVVRNCTPTEDTFCCPQADMTLQEVNGNDTCETYSTNHGKYCCVLNTTSYSTTSSSSNPSKHSTVEDQTLPAPINTSMEFESSKNSSSSDDGSLSAENKTTIIVACSIVGVFIVVIVIVLFINKCKCGKESQIRQNREPERNAKNGAELQNLTEKE